MIQAALAGIAVAVAKEKLSQVLGRMLEKSKVTGGTVTSTDLDKVADQIGAEFESRIKADPLVVNATNSEPLSKSRVFRGTVEGMVLAGVSSAIIIYRMIKTGEVDVEILVVNALILWRVGYALYGRIASGLKPIGE